MSSNAFTSIHRSNRRLAAMLLTAALGIAPATPSSAAFVTFYVEPPNPLNLGMTGHAFVQMEPLLNTQTGNPNLVYGFYPATNNIFGGAGVVRNDSKHGWDWSSTRVRSTRHSRTV